jgi:RND family efflux transporter MFP subunit
MKRMDVPESFEQDTHPHDNPPHTGVLGSGGHGYSGHMTSNLDEHRVAQGVVPVAAGSAAPPVGRLGKGFWVGLMLALLVLAGIVVYGILSRSSADKTLQTETKKELMPEVSVIHPAGAGASGQLVLPGNTQPFVDTPIYSRTNGYLQKWFFDIGAHVRKGQLMATIDTPELDQQLQVAQADLKASQATLSLANITSARYQNLLKSNSVSKQETDQAMGDAASKQAAVEASMAGVRRLEQLQSFERVYAPFSGVVTKRETDIGDLITAGTGGTAKEMFRLAAVDRLRVYVAVPEVYSSVVRDGATATLTLDEFPGESFPGTVARNASAIDPASRTLNVEVDVPNPTGKLLPGAYAVVHFKVPATTASLTIPSNTLLFRAQGMQVGVVRDGKVTLVPVKIAQDHGASVEISSGLDRNDAIILDPSDSLQNGQAVKVSKDMGAAK